MPEANVDLKERIGTAIREARDRIGISRASLAVRLGISPKTIQSWENGRTFIEDLSLIPEIEHELEINFSRLIEACVKGDPNRKLKPMLEDRVRMGPQMPEFAITPLAGQGPRVLTKEVRDHWVAVPVVDEEVMLYSLLNLSRRHIQYNILVPESWVPRGGVMVAVRMNDSGMEPRFYLGDMLLIDCRTPLAEKSVGRVLAFDIHGKGVRIRQLHVDADGERMIAGGWGTLNGRLQYAYRPEKGSRLLGRVVGVLSAAV